MRKGAKSFTQFAVFLIPAAIVFSLLTGSVASLCVFGGLFFVLQFANQLDRRS